MFNQVHMRHAWRRKFGSALFGHAPQVWLGMFLGMLGSARLACLACAREACLIAGSELASPAWTNVVEDIVAS